VSSGSKSILRRAPISPALASTRRRRKEIVIASRHGYFRIRVEAFRNFSEDPIAVADSICLMKKQGRWRTIKRGFYDSLFELIFSYGILRVLIHTCHTVIRTSFREYKQEDVYSVEQDRRVMIPNGIPEFTMVYDRFRTILFAYPLHYSNTFANCCVLKSHIVVNSYENLFSLVTLHETRFSIINNRCHVCHVYHDEIGAASIPIC
jgi:hypothetical protein